ncbi:MAG: hypothetical protein [Wendovervirus sonii]|uniref:Uncharacterized protein n=1 Tax=phage Lak_Megaphage_Sonny TaxID=3109229 RepID=A0ABZ0Z267_9CAUD|nr:MAG: hypothetical protein [phage Lak_Megaphage_Sonny]
MKQLYKKIYEAINTGIQKALVLDDEDDVSIIYQHKKIVNNKNLLPYYVEELLKDSNNKFINYKKILKYYKNSGYTYKVKDLNELKNIIDKIKNFKNVSFEWISNMKDYISIVLDDNSEIYFNEKTDKKPLFLKFANDNIKNTENEILIYLYFEHKMTDCAWEWFKEQNQRVINQDDYKLTINEAENDYSGYENCLKIYNSVSSQNFEKQSIIPAIDYCLNLKVNNYQGYLPSFGQLRIMYDNIDMINYIFTYLKLNKIFTSINWSSTEYSLKNAWYLNFEGEARHYNDKDVTYLVLPLFRHCNK